MGVVENLELPREPVLLDIDIDYFLTAEGEVWWSAEELADQIQSLDRLFTTVAYSVKGGYTPTELRTLAAPFLKEPTEGYRGTELDRAAALVRAQQYEEALTLLKQLQANHPVEAGYLRGSSHHHLEQYEQALEVWSSMLSLELPVDGQGLPERALFRGALPSEPSRGSPTARQRSP